MNIDLAVHVGTELAALGVREICLCAGARNAPLVTVLSASEYFRKHGFFEERSAAFFALGRIKASGRPVAVVTNSGTAAAELLPAVIEAHYSGLPLLVVTADRPREDRGTGAPQAIEQVGIFGSYVHDSLDLAKKERARLNGWHWDGPAHINVCFDEPLMEPASETGSTMAEMDFRAVAADAAMEHVSENLLKIQGKRLDRFLGAVRFPLVIVGSLPRDAVAPVRTFLQNFGAPVYLEAVSGLREDRLLDGIRLSSCEKILDKAVSLSKTMSQPIDGILRIGGVPSVRFWSELDTLPLEVMSIAETPFSGSRNSALITTSLSRFFAVYHPNKVVNPADFQNLIEADKTLQHRLDRLLESEPTSEPGLIRGLSGLVPMDSNVYLGNTLPIREWELAANRESRNWNVSANCGASGIDGQVSTFMGFVQEGRSNWGIVGDLTAMYDFSAPWAFRHLPSQSQVRLVVVNNHGGRIFDRIFADPLFKNRHKQDFYGWAEFWRMHYERWTEIPAAVSAADTEATSRQLIELVPDVEATARFWHSYDEC